MIDWLDSEADPQDQEERIYPLDKIRQKLFEVRELGEGGYLVLNWDVNHSWLDFAVLEFCSSNADDTEVMLSCVFHGGGPSDVLRECRHTHWGEEGYLYYVNGRLITLAFQALSEFFDDMV